MFPLPGSRKNGRHEMVLKENENTILLRRNISLVSDLSLLSHVCMCSMFLFMFDIFILQDITFQGMFNYGIYSK